MSAESPAAEVAPQQPPPPTRAHLDAVASPVAGVPGTVGHCGHCGHGGHVESVAACAVLPLTSVGHHLLTHRTSPAVESAPVDVLVGPTGVFVLATVGWSGLTALGNRLHGDHTEAAAELDAVAAVRLALEADLAEVGLAPGEVRAVVVLPSGSGPTEPVRGVRVVGAADLLAHVAGHGVRLTDAQVDTVRRRAHAFFSTGRRRGEGAEPDPAAAPAALAAPPTALAASRAAPARPTGLHAVDEVETALLAASTSAGLEGWMTFLDPAQARLVRRSFNGPARISGPTGTGKSSVGLHRAVYLARTRPGTVLYTTYLRTLPWVLRQSLRQMAPDVADRVEFAHVRALASRVLRERGIRVPVDHAEAEAGFETAWRDVGAPGPLAGTGVDRAYWREEIEHVIKGRGLTSFDQYGRLARAGRRFRLTPELRVAVWDLYMAYQAQLRDRGVHDDFDTVALADAELRRVPELGRFSAVIVDEAQDLTLAMVRMLHSFVGDVPDGLTLIGDVEQARAPGGYTLAEAGISLAGRGAVLDVNHRSTAQILGFTSGFLAQPDAADAGRSAGRAAGGVEPPVERSVARGAVGRRGLLASAPRTGRTPVVERCSTEQERGERMVAWIRDLVGQAHADAEDIAVLCVDATGVARAMDLLMRASIPVIELSEYGGSAMRAVRVGMIERAKGLEFGQVVMGDVLTSWLDGAPTDEGERERHERCRRELYLGMSRARDGLWVGAA